MRNTARPVRGQLCVYRARRKPGCVKLKNFPRPHGLRVFPCTLSKARSKDEFLGTPFDGVSGRVSVESRRIWMIELVIEEALRRNAPSGASHRRLVGHLSCAFF